MNTRKFLEAGLGLRGIVPPVLTRAVITVVLVAPALWAHVETRIIGLADPASLAQTIPNGISVVHGSITGVISQDKAASPDVPKNALSPSHSPLDQEFRELVAHVNSNSGGSGISLLEGFKGFFASAPSFGGGNGKPPGGALEASLGRLHGILGSNLLAAAGYGVPPNQFWSNADSALVPISEHRLSFDGEPGPRPNVATQYWTTPNVMPVVDMAPGIPAAPVFNSANGGNSGIGGNGGWSSSSSSSPVVSTWSPPPSTASPSNPVPATSYVPFHSASLATSPGISTTTTANTMPRVSSGIVLASIPTVPTASTSASSFSTASLSAGTTGSSGSTFTTSSTPANIGYQFVPVGNTGNTAYNTTTGLGAVGYNYNIGKNDVTVQQYVTFLNSVAGVDTYGLYNTQMNDDPTIAGISRTGSGTTGSPYVYAVIGDGNHPITYVNWYAAARLANWMQNGQPTGLGEVAGSTETGAYTMNGANLNGTTNNTVIITKNAGATVWIPTESEWFKAAYYDPTLNGGAGGYWTYAMKSNSPPFPGNSTTAGGNQANYFTFANGYAVTQSSATPDHSSNGTQNYLTDVGSIGSASYYGTFDQSGLVYDWTDAVIGTTNRGERGGAWWTNVNAIQDSAVDNGQLPAEEDFGIGIRLVSLAVPEPSVVFGLITGGGFLLLRRRKSVVRQARA